MPPCRSLSVPSEIPFPDRKIVPARSNEVDVSRAAITAIAFGIFKVNPFDPRLRPHKIHKLSAAYGKTMHSVSIAGDLRAVFYIEGNTVWSVDIGTHAIYRG